MNVIDRIDARLADEQQKPVLTAKAKALLTALKRWLSGEKMPTTEKLQALEDSFK